MTEPEAVVRAYTDAWLAGDLAAVVDLYHDDLVLHYGGAHSLTGDHVGKDAALTALLTVQARTERVPLAVLDVMASADHATGVGARALDRRRQGARADARARLPRRRRQARRVLALRHRQRARGPRASRVTAQTTWNSMR